MNNLQRFSREVQVQAKSHDELRAIRAQVPELTTFTLNGLFPADNVITVTKNHAVHKIYMSEPAAWVLNATHWFSLLDQPMMIVIWCRNWEDASRFQYLMQILEAQYKDYVPRYQILMFDDSKIYGPCRQWQEPSTIWEGTPVMGFMAETFVDDLPCLSFKDFNPMWDISHDRSLQMLGCFDIWYASMAHCPRQ